MTMRLARTIALGATVATVAAMGIPAALPAAADPGLTGFEQPFLGPERYVPLAPTKARVDAQINAPYGQRRADRLARKLGLPKRFTLSGRQYRLLLSGRGVGGGTPKARASGAVIASAFRYLTNSTATPITRVIDGKPERFVLGSYGLIVNEAGMLESMANDTSPARLANWLLLPEATCRIPRIKRQVPRALECGYVSKFLRLNNGRDSLSALYRSAYPEILPYGKQAQDSSEPDELIPNDRDETITYVGMSMGPPLWLVNFLLIYLANPRVAANMPAYWTPIPEPVAVAIAASRNGQVPYRDFEQYFPTRDLLADITDIADLE
ncbi:hypothetical protein N9C30_00880 [bacterium]|jgi:hypothetical protein|nr:hypothetical protein [bacterium]MDB0018677.1 hypothetical protein [bacterium]